MSPSSDSPFKTPPVVQCASQEACLKRHDPHQLRQWTKDNTEALQLIEEELTRKQEIKRNLETHGRYLCAFEDPDFALCW